MMLKSVAFAGLILFSTALTTAAQENNMTFNTAIEALIGEYDLPENSIDTFRSVSKPAIAMVENASSAAQTGSRLGGSPMVPINFQWPRDESGIKLTFVGQINLNDIPPNIAPLPDTGLIAIFKAGGESDRAYDRVYYFADVDTLQPIIVAPDADKTTREAFFLLTWDAQSEKLTPSVNQSGDIKVIADEDGALKALSDGIEVGFYADEYNTNPNAVALQPKPFIDIPEFEDAENAYAKIGLTQDNSFSTYSYLEASIADGTNLREHHIVGGFAHTWSDPLPKPVDAALARAKAEGWTDLLDREKWFSLIVIQSSPSANFSFGDSGNFNVIANIIDAPKGDFSRTVTLEDN